MADAAEAVAAARAKRLPRADHGILPLSTIERNAAALSRRDVVDALNAHLSHYTRSPVCPGCGGTFIEWALVHGCAVCCRCFWPARVYHYIDDPNAAGERVLYLEGVLYAHPDEVETRG